MKAPADAAPGTYSGTLAVAGRDLPVELVVCPWRCAEPRRWRTHAGLMHSPETVALRYNVPLWSDRHFELMSRTLRFMGDLGNKDALITVLHGAYLGNGEAMVRFRKAEDGGFVPDLSIVEKYLALYDEHVGAPSALIIYAWDPAVKSRRRGDDKVPLTELLADGTTEELALAGYGGAGAEKMWQALMDGIRSLVKQRGWPEDVVMLGWALDQLPREPTVDLFKKVAPDVRWAMWTHGEGHPVAVDGRRVVGGMEIGRYDMPWLPAVRPGEMLKGDGILGGWDFPIMQASSARDAMLEYAPLSQWRNLPEGTVGTPSGPRRIDQYAVPRRFSARGFAHLCMDYWDVDGKNLLFSGRRVGNWDVLHRGHCPHALVAPGPDGGGGDGALRDAA